MKKDLCCNFSASKELYLDNEEEGCTKDVPVGEPVYVEIPLSKEVSFDIEGVVWDKTTQMPVQGATVTLVSTDCEGVEPQTMVTDEKGDFYFKLDNDCCYVVRAEAKDYLADEARGQCTKGLEEAMTLQVSLELLPTKVTSDMVDVVENGGIPKDNNPMNPNNPEDPNDPDYTSRGGEEGVGDNTTAGTDNTDVSVGPSTLNTSTSVGDDVYYLLHIYYDFDQSYLRDEGKSELEKLYEKMEINPDLIVEIGSHTDSRGTYNYNRRLSQRRAEAVVRWLTNRGVDRNRLVAVGYGESRNVNDCKNNVPCSEREHQLNRRTEFRILGSIGEFDVKQVSQPKVNPRVDSCEGCPF